MKMQKSQKNIIQALLKHHIINSEWEIIKLQEITDGLTNHDYIVHAKKKKYFCKYAEPKKRVDYTPGEIKNRLRVESKAMRLVTELTKNKVKIPKIIFYDSEYSVLCLEAVPEWSELLSDLLLSGEVEKWVGRELGKNLAAIHETSLGIGKNRMWERECLKKIRIPVTYKNVSSSKKIQKKIDALGKELLQNAICLVHTDFKPNNIFINKNGEVIIVDFEFMHIGDPAPDCGFLIGIYIHYAFARKEKTKEYLQEIEDFWESYKKNFIMAREKNFEKRVIQHAGVQLLARLDGIIKFPSSQKNIIRNIFRPLGEKMIMWEIKKVKDLKKYLFQFLQ